MCYPLILQDISRATAASSVLRDIEIRVDISQPLLVGSDIPVKVPEYYMYHINFIEGVY